MAKLHPSFICTCGFKAPDDRAFIAHQQRERVKAYGKGEKPSHFKAQPISWSMRGFLSHEARRKRREARAC